MRPVGFLAGVIYSIVTKGPVVRHALSHVLYNAA
jgi:hypothetical protein